jgi:hypothetical protein
MGAFNESISSYSNERGDQYLNFFTLLVDTLKQLVKSMNKLLKEDGVQDRIGMVLIGPQAPRYESDDKVQKEWSNDFLLVYRDVPLCSVFIAYSTHSTGPSKVELNPGLPKRDRTQAAPIITSELEASLREKMAPKNVVPVVVESTKPEYIEGRWTIVIRKSCNTTSTEPISAEDEAKRTNVFQGTPMEFVKLEHVFDFLADVVIDQKPAT